MRCFFLLGCFDCSSQLFLDVVAYVFFTCIDVGYKSCNYQSNRAETDGVVVVTYEEHSNYVELDKAIDTLNRCNVKILGFILNGSRQKEKQNRRLRSYRQ